MKRSENGKTDGTRWSILAAGLVLIPALFLSPAFGRTPESEADRDRPFVSGGTYDKPYLTRLAGKASVGGYIDAQFRFEREEGFKEELTFLLQRINLFTFAPVSDRIRVAAEIEFEDAGEEIKVELAVIDFEIHAALNFRGGIILSPLGRFNLAHDSPTNFFTDRPILSTEVLGVTLSEAGMGFFGAIFPAVGSRVTYEVYAVNGFDDGVLTGSSDGTRVHAGRNNFEDNNNHPSLVGRLSLSPFSSLEVGFSSHYGPYNVYASEGQSIDQRRDLAIGVLDGEFRWKSLLLQGEVARTHVEIPANLSGLFAERQAGYWTELSARLLRGVLSSLPTSSFGLGARYEWVDFDADISGDDVRRGSIGLNFRPAEDTVFKLDYQHSWISDRFDNQARSAAVLFSVASYF